MKSELTSLVVNWRAKHPDLSFPDFDPKSVFNPKILILLESPGPRVKESRIVSMTNNDTTAKNLFQLATSTFGSEEIARNNILLWNTIPWHLDTEKTNSQLIEKSKALHFELIQVLQNKIDVVIFLGKVARDLMPFYSGQLVNCRFFAGHHTGGKAQKTMLIDENKKLFEQLRISKIISHNN